MCARVLYSICTTAALQGVLVTSPKNVSFKTAECARVTSYLRILFKDIPTLPVCCGCDYGPEVAWCKHSTQPNGKGVTRHLIAICVIFPAAAHDMTCKSKENPNNHTSSAHSAAKLGFSATCVEQQWSRRRRPKSVSPLHHPIARCGPAGALSHNCILKASCLWTRQDSSVTISRNGRRSSFFPRARILQGNITRTSSTGSHVTNNQPG